jgi:hypothetical protein
MRPLSISNAQLKEIMDNTDLDPVDLDATVAACAGRAPEESPAAAAAAGSAITAD